MNEEYYERLYSRILGDFYDINEIYPGTAEGFAKRYNVYLVDELTLKIDGEEVGVLRDVLCSYKPIDQVFIDRLSGRRDIVWSMDNNGFTSFHLADQDDDVKEKLDDIFDRHALCGYKTDHIIVYDETLLFTGTEEFIEPPKPQNSVKRWKREKKYF